MDRGSLRSPSVAAAKPGARKVLAPPIWEGPSIGGYHSFERLHDDMFDLAAANEGLVSLLELGRTYNDLPILGLRLEASPHPRKRVLFIGGHHACERISVEVVYLLAEHLTKLRRKHAPLGSFEQLEILFVPMLNPDGHVHAISANRDWRRNRSPQQDTFGVDLNRNYGVGFGTGESSGVPGTPNYRGPSAFSEPETQAMAALFDATKIDALITYHSFSQCILYPWASRHYGGGNARIDALISVSKAMAAASLKAGVHYEVLPASRFYSQPVGGDLCDWALEMHGTLGLTVELPPKNDSSSPGFMLPSKQIKPTFKGHLPAALTFLDRVATL